MTDLRITEKFARVLKAFRGRDIVKKEPQPFLVMLRHMRVFKWPVSNAEQSEFIRNYNKEWFILGSVVDADEIWARQERVRELKQQLQYAEKHDAQMRDRWAGVLADRYHTKIVLFIYRSPDKPLTVEYIQERLQPGHTIVNMGVRYFAAQPHQKDLYIVILDIPGTRNKEITQAYLSGRYYSDTMANSIEDIENTGYRTGSFSDHVQKVII